MKEKSQLIAEIGGRAWYGEDRRTSLQSIQALQTTIRFVAAKIRDFEPGDFDLLWHLDQTCFAPGIAYSKPELRGFIRGEGSFTLVAVNEERIEGFVVVHSGKVGHIITIDVSSEARRLGVGSMLLTAAERRLVSMGSQTVNLETAVDNLGALAFYKRHGYNVVGTWPRYYSNGVDALVLKKRLNELQTH